MNEVNITETINRYTQWYNRPYEVNPYFPSQEKQKEQIESKIKELTKIKYAIHRV